MYYLGTWTLRDSFRAEIGLPHKAGCFHLNSGERLMYSSSQPIARLHVDFCSNDVDCGPDVSVGGISAASDFSADFDVAWC